MRNVSTLLIRLGKGLGTRNRVFATLAALALLVSFSFGAVMNGGFEEGNGASALGWNQFGNSYREAFSARSGARGMKLFGRFDGGTSVSGASQEIDVPPGNMVSASVWAVNPVGDALEGDNFAVLKLVCFDSFGNEILASESVAIRAWTPVGEYQFLTASLEEIPLQTDSIRLFLLFVQPGSTPYAPGSVVFDDVEVQVVGDKFKRLIWADEFNGSDLDYRLWEPMIGDGSDYGIPGWGNNELQYYTGRKQNVVVGGGVLRLIARREQFGGREFTSARLRARGRFDQTYARVEARIKVPAGQGLWPAFWMLPTNSPYGGWAASGELDIMEMVNQADTVHGTIHYGGQWPNQDSSGGSLYRPGGYSDGFHTYAVEWRPDSIRWFVDDVMYFSRSSRDWYSSAAPWNQRAPFDQPFHLLLNLAVGGNWPGSPNASTAFPSEMVVDYVRVYGFGDGKR